MGRRQWRQPVTNQRYHKDCQSDFYHYYYNYLPLNGVVPMHFVTVEEQVFFAAGLHQEAISAVLVVRPHSPDQGLLHMFITFAVIGLLNCYF